MNLLQAYFSQKLIESGFPNDMKIEYCLSYCQGDGVAFYGDVEHTYWCKLFEHIYPGERCQLRKFTRLVKALIESSSYWDSLIKVERNSWGYHYSHFNTMYVDAPSADEFRFFYNSELKRKWYFAANRVEEYKSLWNTFIEDLREYVKDLSRKLEQQGYSILETMPYEESILYSFHTKQYKIEVTASEPLDGHWDNEDAICLCSSLLSGNMNYADIRARVIDNISGIELGSDALGCVVYRKDDRTFDGYRNELILNAIHDARAEISKMRDRFAQIRTN